MWYVSVVKLGTLFADSNFKAWRDYEPRVEWVRGLWGTRKLTHAMFEDYSRRLRVGHADRKRDLTELYADERQQAVRDHVGTAEARTSASLRPLRSFQQVEEFIESFKGASLLRRPILAIVGGTNLGKSILAADVLKRVGKCLNVPSFLEVTGRLFPRPDRLRRSLPRWCLARRCRECGDTEEQPRGAAGQSQAV